MSLFKKKADPLAEKDKALKAEIAALEAQIRKLSHSADSSAPPPPSVPKLRSTALPHLSNGPVPNKSPSPASTSSEPIFEEVHQGPLAGTPEPTATPQHYNELGVRKYDLAAALRRAQNHFKSKPVANPKLVNYLAAGSIHGLRPLRYEKRVARNRVIFLSLLLFLAIWGVLSIMWRR